MTNFSQISLVMALFGADDSGIISVLPLSALLWIGAIHSFILAFNSDWHTWGDKKGWAPQHIPLTPKGRFVLAVLFLYAGFALMVYARYPYLLGALLLIGIAAWLVLTLVIRHE